MFGEDEEIKQLKSRLQQAGRDSDITKRWVKQLMGIKRQLPQVQKKYTDALENLMVVSEYVSELKEQLSGRKIWDKSSLRDLQDISKELKRIGNSYDNEFVVSREDREFHLIYDTIRRLLDKFGGADDERILLLSEVENLSALIKEKLEREKPDPVSLTFFYMDHRDEELVNLPPEVRLQKLTQVAEEEFYQPMYMQAAGIEGYGRNEIKALVNRIAGIL